jgi:patatin-like phospholipase domain-containing protein 2
LYSFIPYEKPDLVLDLFYFKIIEIFQSPMIQKSNSYPINLSLSGCGFLGVYHIGVICAFKEHAPEILDDKMAGCSAGSLVAACAMSGCCLGQMCSDALEIAIRARSRALGPLHPTFSIVDIIRNGLRRILPPNAHEICSGRLFISLTRWKDNKNVIINQFHNREELIQVLICSSFVPYWSGIIPHKFRGEVKKKFFLV